MTQNGSGHHFQMGSDLQRDGMYLEMLDASEACVAEVFYSDVTGKMIVTLEQPGVSIEAVEELLSRVRNPVDREHGIRSIVNTGSGDHERGSGRDEGLRLPTVINRG